MSCADYDPPAGECIKIQCCADNYRLAYALKRYLEIPSPAVNFTLILQGGNWWPTSAHGADETIEEEAARYASYFALPAYHKVLGGRPLVYIFGFGSNATLIDVALRALRAASLEVLGPQGNPYVVTTYSSARVELYFMYRYISRESCSQFDSLPLTSLTILGTSSPWAAAR